MTKVPLVDLKAQYRTIKEEVNAAIREVLENARFLHGEKTKEFAANFAAYCGAKYGIGTSSGTSAIALALIVQGIKHGDEVITTPSTFIATAEAIFEVGATPVFIDIDRETANIDPEKIEAAITERTKAILPVHLYGRIAEMDKIIAVAAKHNLKILEDAAQAHGAEYKGKKAPLSETAAYSFYPGKTFGAYGDAGAIVTNSREVFEKASMLIDHGRKQGEKYKHYEMGYNFRMDELQAAILNVKLKYLQNWVEQRRKHAMSYNKLLRKDIAKPAENTLKEHGMYVYTIRVKNRDELFQKLKEHDIEAVIHYPIPLHLQPPFEKFGYKKGDFPESEKLAEEVLSLPMYPELSEEQIARVAEIVNKCAQ